MNTFRASRLTPGNLFFPAEIIIEPTCITVRKDGFIRLDDKSIYLQDIIRVDIQYYRTGFCKIKFVTRVEDNFVKINGFKAKDAYQIKSLVDTAKQRIYILETLTNRLE